VTPGAAYLGDGRTRFRVWAPKARAVAVRILRPGDGAGEGRRVPLAAEPGGWHGAEVDDVRPGARYRFDLGRGEERPDPASRLQPEGVHGPSEVVDPAFAWSDAAWTGIPLEDWVLYELHVGTFSRAGTFAGVIDRLPELVDLGVTVVELMPVAQFPGERGWGYDGVYPWAVQASYGGPRGLAELVDACHAAGLGVVLDVVYNHLGPEGNYLGRFGPYLSAARDTPWGEAVNLDGPGSDAVRDYLRENALYWLEELHVDGLRLDATDALRDETARHFLEELSAAWDARAAALGRRAYLIAETFKNDPRQVAPRERNGLGLHGHWHDDFHHALHVALTGESGPRYYADFARLEALARAWRQGYVLTGQPSKWHGRRHGRPGRVAARRFVVYAQNHDQVGNRVRGDRLASQVEPPALRLAAAATLLAPFTPLLFMGEEQGETRPFPFFCAFGDADLSRAVARGRRADFRHFGWTEDPALALDPDAPETFAAALPTPADALAPWQRALRALYQELLRLRRALPRVELPDEQDVLCREDEALLWIRSPGRALLLHFGREPRPVDLPREGEGWRVALDTEAEPWGGGGAAVVELAAGAVRVGVTGPQAVLLVEGDAG